MNTVTNSRKNKLLQIITGLSPGGVEIKLFNLLSWMRRGAAAPAARDRLVYSLGIKTNENILIFLLIILALSLLFVFQLKSGINNRLYAAAITSVSFSQVPVIIALIAYLRKNYWFLFLSVLFITLLTFSRFSLFSLGVLLIIHHRKLLSWSLLRNIVLIIGSIAILIFAWIQLSSVRAFPGAEGFGANSLGGRGGDVIFVTNLNDSGAGSLRAALEASGPRTVVFRTGGTITLNSSIKISNPYITIAGQTAPGGGIAIKTSGTFDGAPIVINTHDVIVRHLRVRPGPGPAGTSTTPSTDAIHIEGGSNLIFDHCSLSWAEDEIFDSWGQVENITIQRSILSEGLNQGHAKGDHSAGALMGYGTDKVTMYKNLFAHNWMRNPWMKTDIEEMTATYQFVNNVVYNWGYHGTQVGGEDGFTQANVIGNYYKPGKDYDQSLYNEIMAWHDSKLYVRGNIGSLRPNDSMDEWEIVGDWAAQATTSRRSKTPFKAPNLSVLSASEAYQTVLQEAGATRPRLDAVDRRVINDVRNGTGRIIDNPSQVGGWPNLSRGTASADTDKDGMPDAWEVQNRLNPNNPRDRNGKIYGRGYTNLERYLNSIA